MSTPLPTEQIKRSAEQIDQDQNKRLCTPQPQTASRIIYLGGLPKDSTPAIILNHVKGGAIEKFRLVSERSCAFIQFVDITGATNFYNRHCLRGFSVNGVDVKIGWAKDVPIPTELWAAIQNGATRTIFLGAVDSAQFTEHFLTTVFSVFGPLESVRIVSEKKIAFVQYLDISHAIKALEQLGTDEAWQEKRIAFGKDHCVDTSTAEQQANLSTRNANMLMEHTKALFEAASTGNRTVYLGNLPETIQIEMICNSIKEGLVHNLRYLPEKNCIFITFVESTAAQALYQRAAFTGIYIGGSRLKAGWGKSGPIPGKVQSALRRGATRNVYIGGISAECTVEELKKDFSPFGEMEQVNIVREKNIAFVNFLSIEQAMKAVEEIKKEPLYASLRVSFGKDRCNSSSLNK
jgi:RNA recognition motif-containing protein